MNTVYVTTSWDDGHELDAKLGSALARHGMTGTFYVSPRCRELPESKRLAAGAMNELADQFEVGGHTLTHPHLSAIDDRAALAEITDGRDAVEDIVGRRITSFCYPYGDFADSHPDMVRAAGFTSARTVERFCHGLPDDLFRMGTTLHGYQHLVDGPQILRRTRSPRRAVSMWRNWETLGRQLLDEVCATGGIFHLWGHSWEIDDNDDWGRLDLMLDELARRDVVFLTNGQLAETIKDVAQPPIPFFDRSIA
jgi:peptidoglycan/xylan/chitin deacetylase (PgdA/CDA1 family)